MTSSDPRSDESRTRRKNVYSKIKTVFSWITKSSGVVPSCILYSVNGLEYYESGDSFSRDAFGIFIPLFEKVVLISAARHWYNYQ